MTITQLKYFLSICHHGKISTASEHLHVSAPTISVAIKQLEEELELSLFVRNKGQMFLTSDGIRLQEKAADLVDRFDRLKDELKQPREKMPVIHLGAPSTLAEHLCGRIIADFTVFNSTVLFEMPSLSSSEAAQQVEDGKLELAVCDQLAVTSKQLEFVPIIDSTVSGYVREDHPLAGKERVTPNMLRDEELLLVSKRAMFSMEVMHWFRDGGVRPSLFMYSQREIMSVTLSMVERHNAVAFFLDKLFADKIPNNIKSFTLDPPLCFKIGIVRKKDGKLSKEAKQFWEFCCQHNYD